jgi:hypothetical protein
VNPRSRTRLIIVFSQPEPSNSCTEELRVAGAFFFAISRVDVLVPRLIADALNLRPKELDTRLALTILIRYLVRRGRAGERLVRSHYGGDWQIEQHGPAAADGR